MSKQKEFLITLMSLTLLFLIFPLMMRPLQTRSYVSFIRLPGMLLKMQDMPDLSLWRKREFLREWGIQAMDKAWLKNWL